MLTGQPFKIIYTKKKNKQVDNFKPKQAFHYVTLNSVSEKKITFEINQRNKCNCVVAIFFYALTF